MKFCTKIYKLNPIPEEDIIFVVAKFGQNRTEWKWHLRKGSIRTTTSLCPVTLNTNVR